MEQKLKTLGSNHAGVMRLKNGELANYGSIRVENGNFIHYTGKGLREVHPPIDNESAKELRKLDERTLVELGHIDMTPITDISEIVS